MNPRWTGFTHTAKAQMQCLNDFPISADPSLSSMTFDARLIGSLMPARSCCAVRKISNCRSKTRARFGYMTYRSGCSNAVNRACAEKLAMCRRFQCPDSTRSRHWSNLLHCVLWANRVHNSGESVRTCEIWSWSAPAPVPWELAMAMAMASASFPAIQQGDFRHQQAPAFNGVTLTGVEG